MTLEKIAKEAHVSVSTVSRALNDSYDISEETRKEILRIAERSGYFQKKKRTKKENRRQGALKIAIISPEIISPYYSSICSSFNRLICEKGSKAIVYNHDFDNSLKREIIINCINDPSCDAIICLDDVDGDLINSDTPIVSFSSHQGSGTIITNVKKSIFIGAEYLQSIGKKRISFASEDLTCTKEDYFKEFFNQKGTSPYSTFNSHFRFEQAGVDCAEYFMGLDELPDGILCAYDSIAFGLIYQLKKYGIRIPEDVSVVGINNIPSAEYFCNGLTTVGLESEDAICEIVNDIHNSATVNKKYEFNFKLYLRRT